MSFLSVKNSYRGFDIRKYLASVDRRRVESVLGRERLTELDFLALLSDAALDYLELMARRAFELTRRCFGNAVVLFTPMYVSNYCDNTCAYCSFAQTNRIGRRQLSIEEVRLDGEEIGRSGMRHVLLLSGESRRTASVEYLGECIGVLKEYFSSIAVEVYPLTESEYGLLRGAGADSLTIYQEVYDEEVYRRMHQGGPKSDYAFRIEAPERACRRDMHAVTIGALLGLQDHRTESFFTALHLKYLQDTFPAVDVGVSLPRIRPLVKGFTIEHPVDERRLVQLLVAFRLFAPTAGITLSTREEARLRDGLVPLGVTKMSAGVSTAVGGHSGSATTGQFEIADRRTVGEIQQRLLSLGFQPVMHDWNHLLSAERKSKGTSIHV